MRAGELNTPITDKARKKANHKLLAAARDLNLRGVGQALDGGAEVRALLESNVAQDTSYTLFMALLSLDFVVAEKLVRGGFPLVCEGIGGSLLSYFCHRKPLHEIFGKEEPEDFVPDSYREIIAFLIEHGADPNAKLGGDAPLFNAIFTANGPDADGEIVRMLLAARVDPNESINDVGDLPLVYAAQNGNLRVIEMLLQAGADINGHKPYEAMTMEDQAAYESASEESRELHHRATLETATAVFAAGRAKQNAAVRLLLQRGADPDIPIRDGFTPMIDAIVHFDNESDEGWEKGLEYVSLLIDANARLDAGERGEYSPLIEAIRKPAWAVAELLLDAGAPIVEQLQKAEKCGCGCYGGSQHGPPTPLSVASSRGLDAVVGNLIQRGAVQANRPSARRALRVARDNGERSIARMIKAELSRCAQCGDYAVKRGFPCAGCNETYYCSAEHRDEHFLATHSGLECAELRDAARLDDIFTSQFRQRAALFDSQRVARTGQATCEPCEDEENEADAAANECPSCLEDMDEDDTSKLSCGHCFHPQCINIWFDTQAASGAKWKDAGTSRPSDGEEIKHHDLAVSLMRQVEFTASEFMQLRVPSSVKPNSFIKVGESYYQPAVSCPYCRRVQ